MYVPVRRAANIRHVLTCISLLFEKDINTAEIAKNTQAAVKGSVLSDRLHPMIQSRLISLLVDCHIEYEV